MKKLITSILATTVIVCSLPMASLAADSTIHFGGSQAITGQDGSAQGQNGWYYMLVSRKPVNPVNWM